MKSKLIDIGFMRGIATHFDANILHRESDGLKVRFWSGEEDVIKLYDENDNVIFEGTEEDIVEHVMKMTAVQYLVNINTATLAKELDFVVPESYVSFYYDSENKNQLVHTSKIVYPTGAEPGRFTDEQLKFLDWKGQLIGAPTQSQLQKWLREIQGIEVYVHPYFKDKIKGVKSYEVVVDKLVTTFSGYNTYEEALEKGLLEALNIINK